MSTSEYAHPEALVNAAWIAELYENGWGVAQDYGKAHKWFQKAADAGNTDAMINLARLYKQALACKFHISPAGAHRDDCTDL
jgi:TPR repeat protein